MDSVKEEREETAEQIVQNQRPIKQEEFPLLNPRSQPPSLVDHPRAKFEAVPNRGQRQAHASYVSNSQVTPNDYNVNRRQHTNIRRHAEGYSDVICGPRANRLKTPDNKQYLPPFLLHNQVNSSNFEDDHVQAKFYLIKSFNEDDVHKSIKYSVWSSTQSGNKKLDDTFWDAEARAKRTGTKCPVFFFFSVNTSGQFVGVAEMTGPVDFTKSMNFWQEERWSGFFPVRWHIVKDVPNIEFHSIILENNNNRPVYFSRDTQEIGHTQGLQMLQLFKNYTANTKILDDFDFYDARERAMRARRNCYYVPSLVQLQQKVERSYTSMNYLEEDFDRMQVSAGPRTAAPNGRTSSHASTRRPQFNGKNFSTRYGRWH